MYSTTFRLGSLIPRQGSRRECDSGNSVVEWRYLPLGITCPLISEEPFSARSLTKSAWPSGNLKNSAPSMTRHPAVSRKRFYRPDWHRQRGEASSGSAPGMRRADRRLRTRKSLQTIKRALNIDMHQFNRAVVPVQEPLSSANLFTNTFFYRSSSCFSSSRFSMPRGAGVGPLIRCLRSRACIPGINPTRRSAV